MKIVVKCGKSVLNLVISGIPSILAETLEVDTLLVFGFKPCYKWNTFNTENISDLKISFNRRF